MSHESGPQPQPTTPTNRVRRRPSLSFCITARGPAARVRALIELIRPHADEVVLAVDRAGDQSTLDACADLADQRLTFECRASPASLISWIAYRCHEDWILRLDDDEVPSPELLAALPDLMQERHPTHFFFPCRWLYPDADHFLDCFPWTQGPQPRLFRNLPGLWSFEGVVHDAGRFLGERRMVDMPMYHCNLVITTLEQRLAKVTRYERLSGVQMLDGVSANAAYLPEQWPDPAVAPVPLGHRAAIAAVLHPVPVPARRGPCRAPVWAAEATEIEAFNSSRPVTSGTYRGRIAFARHPHPVRVGAVRHQLLLVTNEGDAPWFPGAEREPRIRVGCRWRDPATDLVIPEEQPRSYFTETVAPRQTTMMWLGVVGPTLPGEYVLEVELVHEDVRWFGCAARATVTVQTADNGGMGEPDATAQAQLPRRLPSRSIWTRPRSHPRT